MTDICWIDHALIAARPKAIAALLRYFRDLDTAEEAFQEACLRALKAWPANGPPRDPAAWLIFVGRNGALDGIRKTRRTDPLPDEREILGVDDAEASLVQRLDDAHFRDDILRLMFVCCDPQLPVNQQIALALRVVCGLSLQEIARAFLISERAMEQRITRAKRRIGRSQVPFDPPGAAERAERLAAVAAMIYLLFNEGYSATGGSAHIRTALCDEAVRLSRLLLTMFPSDPEIMGLTALCLLQHARTPARLTGDGEIVLLEDQNRSLWRGRDIAEGLVLVEKAQRHAQRGPYQLQAAIAAEHVRASEQKLTDWKRIASLYGELETVLPTPVVALNRAVAISKVDGPEAGLSLLQRLAGPLDNYFYFYGVKGALLSQLGRCAEARSCFDQAISRANTPAEAIHIRAQLDRLTP